MPENTTPRHSHRTGLDPRNPFVFDVREVGRRAGATREYRRSVPAPAGLGLDLVGVPQGAPLALELRLESVTEGVLVTGTVTAPLTGECGRCLEPLSAELDVDVCELFAWPNSATDETTEQDEVHRIDGDYLDVEPVVRDSVVLGLPWTPLCRPDCGGLCPDCGQRLDDLPAGHAHDVLDPRWAALAAFADGDADGGPAQAGSDTPDSPTHQE
jgi:uncharacterized protein